MGHPKRTNIHNIKVLEGNKRERCKKLIQEITNQKNKKNLETNIPKFVDYSKSSFKRLHNNKYQHF